MNTKKLKIIKSDQRGIVYQCGQNMFVSRKKGTITADHIHSDIAETIYLFKGTIELTIGKKVKKIIAPAKIKIPKKTYHKILAISDIDFLKA